MRRQSQWREGRRADIYKSQVRKPKTNNADSAATGGRKLQRCSTGSQDLSIWAQSWCPRSVGTERRLKDLLPSSKRCLGTRMTQ